MQLLITSKGRENFDTKVNDALFHGASVVAGTMTISQTSYRKANGSKFHQSRYAIVVELTSDQSASQSASQSLGTCAARTSRADARMSDCDADCDAEDLGGLICGQTPE